MKRSFFASVLLLLGVGVTSISVHAQSTNQQLKRFQKANSHLRNGRAEQAIQILETLHAEAPKNTTFYRKLKEAYERVKRYDDALQLLEKRIGASPTPALLSEKARLQHLKGNKQAASDTWDRALSLAPDRARTYRTVYETLVDSRLFKKAIEVLKRGRSALNRPTAFRTELASLYGMDGQHKNAMREYVALLADAPQRYTFVRSRLQTFIERGKGLEASISVLRQAVEESPQNASYRKLLAWLFMEQKKYKAAFDVYRALDRLNDKQGRTLFQFAQKALDAQEYEVATGALKSILDRYPSSEVSPKAQRVLGDAFRQWAESKSSPPQDSSRYEEALNAYQTFLEKYPDHQDYPQVLLRLGLLHLEVYHSSEKAKASFDELVEGYSGTSAAAEAQYHLARIALRRGDLKRARLFFSRLAKNAESSDLANRARYEVTLLSFYRGAFDSALARAKSISENPGSDVANDALELKVLLQEHRGPDSLDVPLQTFARARLYDRQRRHEEALTALDSLLTNYPRHSLVDNARFHRAELHLARHDTSAALNTFRQIPKQHPNSSFADRSLFRIGSLLESRDLDAEAIEAYDQLLTKYPNSLYARDARTRLRALMQSQG